MTQAEIKAMEQKLSEALANQARLLAEIEKAKEENTRLTKAAVAKVKVTGSLDKGTVSVYGLNAKYPVSLYPEQWIKLLDMAVEIKAVCARPEIQAAAQRTKAAKAQARNTGVTGTVLQAVGQ